MTQDMIDIKYYAKLFFNEETGKERWSLIPREAENIYKNNSPEKSWDIATECYGCELFYIQMLAVSIMGFIAYKNKTALNFLKNTVSENPSWQVQEFLAISVPASGPDGISILIVLFLQVGIRYNISGFRNVRLVWWRGR